ncbi:MAG: hypothetical protein QOF51_1768, partial [Chloroflexota bacterium]|nr:hypothetical protein [Chloroflexota bacterium]
EEVAARYATTDEGRRALIRGARETYLIDRAFIGTIANALERLP